MAAPTKPEHRKVSKYKGNFYLTDSQHRKLMAECDRQGGASVSHVVRQLIHRHIEALGDKTALSVKCNTD